MSEPFISYDDLLESGRVQVLKNLLKVLAPQKQTTILPVVESIGWTSNAQVFIRANGSDPDSQMYRLRLFLDRRRIRYGHNNEITLTMSETDFLKLFS